MRAVQSDHPPGVVVMVTGDLARYTVAQQSLIGAVLPVGTAVSWITGCLIAEGLNKGMRRIHDRPELDWVWIMGDDHTFAPDILLRMLDRDLDVVLPLCLNRAPPLIPVIKDWSDRDNPKGKSLQDMPTSGLYKLEKHELCGDAGMLIRRRVLEAIEEPWYDHRRSGHITAEDQAFSQRIHDAGFDIHVDCDNIMGHVTPMTITPTVLEGEWAIDMAVNERRVCAIKPQVAPS